MGILNWLGDNWFEFVQSAGVFGGFLLTTWTIRREEKARQISNLIAVNQRHSEIWSALYGRPELSRIREERVDLRNQPLSNEELLFVKSLYLHLDTVRRVSEAGLFVKIHRLQEDIRNFMRLPIPKAVWEKLRPFFDDDFISFVEDSLANP